MCGIVGYVGPRDATPIILDGLKRLEYRGYDSAGMAVVGMDGDIAVRREVGKLESLLNRMDSEPVTGRIGIGHTRWATHGEPCQRNAHPHLGRTGRVAVVHNGIIENFRMLRDRLRSQGQRFA
ncbi:MAG: glutamine--fructose-6-phosphate aminotransferase, partial [Anaerolineae bacterium]